MSKLITPVSDFEFWRFFVIMMAASTIGDGGKNIWEKCEVSKFMQRPSMRTFMPCLRFEQVKN